MNAIGTSTSLKGQAYSLTDPFNYPSLNRNMGMSLSTIQRDKDNVPIVANQFRTSRRGSLNLSTCDIPGASPKKHCQANPDRISQNNTNLDIAGSQPRALHFTMNRPDNQLRTDDIPFTKPQVFRFETRRNTNPIRPEYTLSQVEIKPATPAKFVRDQMYVRDIEKCLPVIERFKRAYVSDPLGVKDVPGAQPRNRTYQRNQFYDAFTYEDVTKLQVKSQRAPVNPLAPTYKAIDDDGKSYEIGPIDGNQSKKIGGPKSKFAKDIYSCADVLGASPDSKGRGVWEGEYKRRDPYESRNLLIGDIPGAKAGSLVSGMKSQRHGNPLDQVYQYPGHTELETKNPYSKTKKELQLEQLQKAKKANNTIAQTGAQVIEKLVPLTEKSTSNPVVPTSPSNPPVQSQASLHIGEDKTLLSPRVPGMSTGAFRSPATAHEKLDKFVQK